MFLYGWTLETISKTSTRLRNALLSHCPTLFNFLHEDILTSSLTPGIYSDMSINLPTSGNSTLFNKSVTAPDYSRDGQNTTQLGEHNLNGGHNFNGNNASLISNTCFSNDPNFADLMGSSDGHEYDENYPLFSSNMDIYSHGGVLWNH